MLATTQIFEGKVFVLHPTTPNAYIRLDALERTYNGQISAYCFEAQLGCGTQIERYSVKLLQLLRRHAMSLAFPYDQLFKRCAGRRGLLLDDLTLARAVRASERVESSLHKASA